jgi:ribonuclease HI
LNALSEAEGNSLVSLKHIPGHRGILGNMKADRLAQMGANMAQSIEQDYSSEFDDE